MSAKLILPGDPHEASPVIWRQVINGACDPVHSQNPAARAAQLEQQYEQRIREAHDAGLREGEASGRKRAAAELQSVVERLARSIDEIAGLRPRLRREAEADLIHLSLAIARRILHREISVDPEALRGLAMAALTKLQGQEISRVRVHPKQVSLLKSCLQEAVNGREVEVVADPSREPGAVVFETGRGNLDASVDAQLEEIERGLADRLRKNS